MLSKRLSFVIIILAVFTATDGYAEQRTKKDRALSDATQWGQ